MALQPEPIVHSLTMPGVTLDVVMAPRICHTRISDYLPWSQAWVVYFEATIQYHPRLLPHLCSETFCGATPGGPWSVILGRVRVRVRAQVPGTRHTLRGPATYGRHAPAVQPSPPQWPWGSPGDIPRAFFHPPRRSGSSIALPFALRRGPKAPCTCFWICPRLEEPRLIRAFPERSCGTVYLRGCGHAFCLCPVRPADWPLLHYMWEERVYVDLRLPFGARSSPFLFTPFAEALPWIAVHVCGCSRVLHYLDDYFLVRDSHAACVCDLQAFQDLCHNLSVPLTSENLVLPTCCLQFLGVTLDSSLQEMRLPPDKLARLRDCLPAWWTWQKCTKRELLSLIGVLPFACKVVCPGHIFLRRLIDISMTVLALAHSISLPAAAQADIAWWVEFLPSWNGRAFFLLPPVAAAALGFATDASMVGRPCTSAAPAPFCPFTVLYQLLVTHPTFAGSLFAFRDGSYLTRARLGHILHPAFHSSCDLNTHSFRIGDASAAGTMGFSSAMIQALWRLQSDSFRRYVQLPSKCVPSPAPRVEVFGVTRGHSGPPHPTPLPQAPAGHEAGQWCPEVGTSCRLYVISDLGSSSVRLTTLLLDAVAWARSRSRTAALAADL